MEIKLYNYSNETIYAIYKDIQTIEYISINVVSGDEIMAIRYINNDGNVVEDTFDSDTEMWRVESFYDGGYVILQDRLDGWMNFEPNINDDSCISYQRLEKFGRCIECSSNQ